MGRIRTVKPELFSHEQLFDAETETGLPLRLAFIGLFTCCDREGRFKWRPRTLKTDVMPHDNVDFARVLDALLTRGFVSKYACNDNLYGFIPSWHKHQVINNRESQSEIPAPTETSLISITSTRAPRVADACPTPLVHAQGEGKGKEGKGKEEEGEQPIVQPTGRTTVDRDQVDAVFRYWQTARGHDRAKLDDKRCKAIKARIKDGYTVEDLCRAVDGIARSPHHMGQNDQRTVYDDIELICRTAANVDKFRKLVEPQAFTDPGLQRQVEILQDWMARP